MQVYAHILVALPSVLEGLVTKVVSMASVWWTALGYASVTCYIPP